ncbi:30S ribosomal protein S4 [archaeon]|nr:30S ribosomal protein S4 [archaeon]
MGSPKKSRRKYSKPSHPWQKERIDQEKIILNEYGLVNKKEIWKASSQLRKFKSQAKKLTALNSEQAEKEKEQLINRLFKLNLVAKTANLDDVLSLELKNILDRRLQTRVFKQGLTRTIKQARQFITHGHLFIGDKKMTIPSYMVKLDEESKIIFNPKSKISSIEHPERPQPEKESVERVEEKPKKKEEKPKEVKKEPPKEEKKEEVKEESKK